MKEIRINPRETALLVIDLQKGFVDEGAFCELPAARKILPLLVRLIDVCRKQ